MRLKSFNLLNAASMRQRSLLEALAEGEGLLPIGPIWNDRLGSLLIQLLAQLGAIIFLVAEHAFRPLPSPHQAPSHGTIVRFSSGQQDGDQAPFSICECVDLRVAPSKFLIPLY